MERFIKPDTVHILGGVPTGMDPIMIDWTQGKATLIEWKYTKHYTIGGFEIDTDMRALVLKIVSAIRDGVPKYSTADIYDIIEDPHFTFDKVTLKNGFGSRKKGRVDPILREPISLKPYVDDIVKDIPNNVMVLDATLYVCQVENTFHQYMTSVIVHAMDKEDAKKRVEEMEDYRGMNVFNVQPLADRLGLNTDEKKEDQDGK